MQTRTWSSGAYRFGFNGKEDDDETITQDYGMRVYDSRIARFQSIDPISSRYPELTTYQFCSNRPLDGVDLDGLEYVTVWILRNDDGTCTEINRINHYLIMSDADVEKVHGKTYSSADEFYKEYSAPFEAEGRGVKTVYYKNSENGPVVDESKDPKWESHQEGYVSNANIFRHGIWAGAGGITLPCSESNDYPNADASFGFIDELDALAKAHDLFYDYKGYLDGDSRKNNFLPEAIEADKAFLNGVKKIIKSYDEAKAKGEVYIDQVTKRPISAEEIQTARCAIILFTMDINRKVKSSEKAEKKLKKSTKKSSND